MEQRPRILSAWNLYCICAAALHVPLMMAANVIFFNWDTGIASVFALVGILILGLVEGVAIGAIYLAVVLAIARIIRFVDRSITNKTGSISTAAWGGLVFVSSIFPIPFIVFLCIDILFWDGDARSAGLGVFLSWMLTFTLLSVLAGLLARSRAQVSNTWVPAGE